MTLDAEMLALIERTPLERGKHQNFAAGACAMELLSYVAGEKFSDHPDCVCPVLGAFVRAWNDGLPDDERNALLKPLLPRLTGTRGSNKIAERRVLMAADWLVRVHAPAWLRLAMLDAHADVLSSLPEITSMAQVPSIRGPIEAARRDAAAAWAAARDAARAAARAAARDAARDAARAAARAAARDAAMDAARAAARDAARATAMDAAMDAAWAAAMDAARDAAWETAWATAMDAAMDAAWAAARAAARDAAWETAWEAARNAAREAAREAAWEALNGVRLSLQRSALELVERMIAVSE